MGQVCGRTAGGHHWVRFVGELQEVAVGSGLWGKQQEVTIGSGLWKNSRRSLLGQVCGRTAGGHCWVRFASCSVFCCRPEHLLQHALSSTSFIRTNIYIAVNFLH